MTELWTITPDWPAQADEPMDHESVLDVLDQVSAYCDGAVESLSETIIPVVGEDGQPS